ncbi:unnamed protein product, partial [Rotaria sordida]
DADKISNEDEIRPAKVSIGVGRDVTSAIRTKQQTITTTIGDECEYVGNIYADKKHGEGILTWSDGRIYKGAFFADKRHGILIYKSIQSADVGFWLSEHLVRLLYPHPMLNFDILTSIDLDSVLKKKSNALFCQNIEDENSSLTRYLIKHSDRLDEAMYERYAQVDVYLESLNDDDNILKEKIS